jgi:voltage-gated potassium channel
MRSPRRPAPLLPVPDPTIAGVLDSPWRNLALGGVYMAFVILFATVAYVAAGWTLGDAFYMVIITVYTVGYDEVHAIDTPLLRVITISTIVLGCTGMIYLTGALVQFFTVNHLDRILGIRRMSTQIDALSDHVIVCGFGRIGRQIAQGLEAGRAHFVVLEAKAERAAEARSLGYLSIQADATDETALLSAGITRARVLATVLPNDAANVFITLSARKLSPSLEIIARGEAPSTEGMLLQAGANRVVLPTHLSAERIVEIVLYENTEHFIRGSDSMKDFEKALVHLGLQLEMVSAATGSPSVGQSVETLEHEAGGAFFIVQITGADGESSRPDPQTRIKTGDGILLLSRGLSAHTLFEPCGRSTFRKAAR